MCGDEGCSAEGVGCTGSAGGLGTGSGMTVCLKSSSLRLGRKQTIRSQVISHRSEYPVLESALWKIPAVSITSSMFFRDSGIASNSKSLDPACMYLSMKSRMVSQRAAKVGKDSRGERCWRKTFDRSVQALILVSSIPPTSAGLMLSSSLVSKGKSTLLKQDSHSVASSV